MYSAVNSISDNWNDNLQSLNQEKNEASVTSLLRGFDVSSSLPNVKFTRFWTSVSFPLCQRSCLTWQIMMNTYVVIFCWLHFLAEVIIPDIRILSSLV